uniref:Cyclically-permuted mutarotase family protein n=1 Tax=Prevotella sp. GTC17253 TaxID=3236793 RepID=A0AB33ISB9_9BACT
MNIQQLKGFPTAETGIEKGVSACFAGLIQGHLVMAGGCNFPERPAAEKGEKRYYKGIYATPVEGLDIKEWTKVGELPTSIAYGMSIVKGDTLYCIGGNNTESSLCSVSAITFKNGKATVTSLPPLPAKLDNHAGCAVGDSLIVLGGNWNGHASNRVLMLELSALDKGWQQLPDFPGIARVQPVCASHGNSFCLWGGSSPRTEAQDAQLGLEGWQFNFCSATWSPLPAPTDAAGESVFLGGGCATTLADGSIVAMGGVNKDVFLSAVNHPQPGYMTHPVEWYRFNRLVMQFKDGQWKTLGESEATARAGAALFTDSTHLYEIGGELKPGIRSTGIYKITLK